MASLGKDRWYWVVWPSLELLQAQGAMRHLADGYERTKSEAVERALEVARADADRVAAKYAREHRRQLSRERRRTQHDSEATSVATLGTLELLYHDVRDETRQEWYSVPHRVLRKTQKYVYVEQEPYDPDRLTGAWPDQAQPTYRLSRVMLEQEGCAFVAVIVDIDDPLFFTTPYQERVMQYGRTAHECFGILGLSFPSSPGDVKAAYRRLAMRAHPDGGGNHEEFLALQSAYEEAPYICRYQP